MNRSAVKWEHASAVIEADHEKMTRTIPPILSYLDYLYKLEQPGVLGKPYMVSREETLHDLISSDKSLVRFGDGEFFLVEGRDLLFQRADVRIQARLTEILESDCDNIMIGLEPYCWTKYHGTIRQWDWVLEHYHALRAHVEPHLVKGKKYYDTSVTLAYKGGEKQAHAWFSKWQSLWQDKDIALICGKHIFEKLEYNVFDNAKSIEYIYVPMRDAFDEYEKILRQAEKIRADKLICIIAGPTATVLAYDLASLHQRRALDVGHLAKDYDCWKKGLTADDEAMKRYFLPD